MLLNCEAPVAWADSYAEELPSAFTSTTTGDLPAPSKTGADAPLAAKLAEPTELCAIGRRKIKC